MSCIEPTTPVKASTAKARSAAGVISFTAPAPDRASIATRKAEATTPRSATRITGGTS